MYPRTVYLCHICVAEKKQIVSLAGLMSELFKLGHGIAVVFSCKVHSGCRIGIDGNPEWPAFDKSLRQKGLGNEAGGRGARWA